MKKIIIKYTFECNRCDNSYITTNRVSLFCKDCNKYFSTRRNEQLQFYKKITKRKSDKLNLHLNLIKINNTQGRYNIGLKPRSVKIGNSRNVINYDNCYNYLINLKKDLIIEIENVENLINGK